MSVIARVIGEALDLACPGCSILDMTTIAVNDELRITLAVEGEILAGRLTPNQSFDLAEQLVRCGITRAMEEAAEEYVERQDIQSHA